MRNSLLYTTALALALLLAACGAETKSDTRVVMGTYVTLTVSTEGTTRRGAAGAINEAFGEIDRVDALMSTYKPESRLSEINDNAGVRPVRAEPEVIETVEKALAVAKMTDGAFDPTVGPLVRLWKIGSDSPRVPSQSEIDEAKRLVGYEDIVIDKAAGTVFIKKKGMALDLGGVAKGYASDLAAAKLKGKTKGGIVAVAGDLKVFGTQPGDAPWNVGIQNPREEGVMAKLAINDGAVSTSGDYERYFVKDGMRYHHILDPRTGQPAKGLMSVTVLSQESWLSDAMATGLFVLGPDKGYKLAQGHPEFEVLMITSDWEILATGRFKNVKVKKGRWDK